MRSMVEGATAYSVFVPVLNAVPVAAPSTA